MSLFGMFKSEPFIKKVINEYGFERTAETFAQIVSVVFDQKYEIKYQQMTQFLREEAEAASMGDANAQAFARTLFTDPTSYRGAMSEEAKYPIDHPGGPQQTLLKIVLSLKDDPELMVKFRCAVVKRIAIYQAILSIENSHIPGADAIINEQYPGIGAKLESAANLWKELAEKYEKELRSIFK